MTNTYRDDLAIAVYELYRDVHGIKPRWLPLNDMSVHALEAEYTALEEQSKLKAIEDVAMEERAIESFELVVAETIANGAGNRETAIRWMKDANDWGNDMDGLCFEFGLPYGYFNKGLDIFK